MPAKDPCPHDSGTYIDVVGWLELTKCATCDTILRRTKVGSDPHDD